MMVSRPADALVEICSVGTAGQERGQRRDRVKRGCVLKGTDELDDPVFTGHLGKGRLSIRVTADKTTQS